MIWAQLLAAVLTYRRQPCAWPRPRPAYLPHPCRWLPRVRGMRNAVVQHGNVEALSHPTVMAAKSDPIQINCKFETYELIHRSVVAAARRARQDGDDKLRLALSNVLLTLGEAQGLSTHHLSDLNLWDVD